MIEGPPKIPDPPELNDSSPEAEESAPGNASRSDRSFEVETKRFRSQLAILDLEIESLLKANQDTYNPRVLTLLHKRVLILLSRQESINPESGSKQKDEFERLAGEISSTEGLIASFESKKEKKLDLVTGTISEDMGGALDPATQEQITRLVKMLPDDAKANLTRTSRDIDQIHTALEQIQYRINSEGGDRVVKRYEELVKLHADNKNIAQISTELRELRSKEKLAKKVATMLEQRKGKLPGFLSSVKPEEGRLIEELKSLNKAKKDLTEFAREVAKSADQNSAEGSRRAELQAEYDKEFSRRKLILDEMDQLKPAVEKVLALYKKREPFEQLQERLKGELFDNPALSKVPADFALTMSRRIRVLLQVGTKQSEEVRGKAYLQRLREARGGLYWRAFKAQHPAEFEDFKRALNLTD